VDPYELARRFGIYFVLALVVAGAQLAYSGFLTGGNIELILSQNAELGVVAVGMTFVIICGGFDLSVGAIYAAAATSTAMVGVHHSVVLAYTVGVMVGFVCGLINGVLVTRLRVNAFVATLGTSTIFSGLILLKSNNNPYSPTNESFLWLGNTTLLGMPMPMIILILTFAAGWLVLNRTVYGRRIFSTGGSLEATRLTGVRTSGVVASTYVMSGTLAGAAGVINASRLGSGQGSIGQLLALQAIAVVVVGGTTLAGGEGSLFRTAVGLLILASLENIFFSLSVNDNWQAITQGAIIVAAVAFDQWLRVARGKARSRIDAADPPPPLAPIPQTDVSSPRIDLL
jgi:ribose/xylose/arabinose/galactoside ABC-type transport system permease subunit